MNSRFPVYRLLGERHGHGSEVAGPTSSPAKNEPYRYGIMSLTFFLATYTSHVKDSRHSSYELIPFIFLILVLPTFLADVQDVVFSYEKGAVSVSNSYFLPIEPNLQDGSERTHMIPC